MPTPHHGAKPCDGVAQLIRRIVACRRRPSPGRLRKLHVCCFEPPVCTVHAVTDASTMSEDRTQWGSPLRSFRWALRRLRWHQRLACFLHFTRSALPRRGEQPRPADGRGRRRPRTAADGPYSCSHSKLNICHDVAVLVTHVATPCAMVRTFSLAFYVFFHILWWLLACRHWQRPWVLHIDTVADGGVWRTATPAAVVSCCVAPLGASFIENTDRFCCVLLRRHCGARRCSVSVQVATNARTMAHTPSLDDAVATTERGAASRPGLYS